jgi:EcoRII C terminal/Restriction endonuclease EcoRII, N-terminal
VAEENELADWFERVSGPEWLWYVKYLSANDTYAKANVHQGGPYVAKEVLRVVFPRLSERAEREENPDLFFDAIVDSHEGHRATLRLVWYNSRRLGQRNGRDEARLTRWGATDAPVVAADSTGALVVFAYHRIGHGDADGLRVWVARNLEEHDRIVDRVGPVEPGVGLVLTSTGVLVSRALVALDRPCALTSETTPASWKERFPSGEEIVARVIEHLPNARALDVDARLMRRRQCEYEMFRSVEELHVLPRLRRPFTTVEGFLEYAHAVTNRRKSRSGRSLELQLAGIFQEEGLQYSYGQYTEGRRKPDFIFPSIESYWDGNKRDNQLRMLAAKTTVKDRWRQILNEARRVEVKHLLTLQEGVSAEQLQEMAEEGVVLVVPRTLHRSYPVTIRSRLMTLERFVSEVRQCALT